MASGLWKFKLDFRNTNTVIEMIVLDEQEYFVYSWLSGLRLIFQLGYFHEADQSNFDRLI